MDLMTVGYEGLSLDRFFDLLRDNRVETIVDVRQNPFSRKPGFSKSALEAAAASNGFSYVHLRYFGCPKDVRDDYKSDSDWARYTERFYAYLDTLEAELILLAGSAHSSRCCLLCFEADPATCHRSYVAERVAEVSPAPLIVRHIRSIKPATFGNGRRAAGISG